MHWEFAVDNSKNPKSRQAYSGTVLFRAKPAKFADFCACKDIFRTRSDQPKGESRPYRGNQAARDGVTGF